MKNKFVKAIFAIVLGSALVTSCKPKNSGDAVSGDAAQKAYVAPGNMMSSIISYQEVSADN